MKKNYKYKAFICYSHKNKKFAEWLHKSIENYKIPKSLREKYPNLPKDLKRFIFRDEEELPVDSALTTNLKDALDNSEFLIVICSPDATKSSYVEDEIKHFKSKRGEDNVLAIIVDGEPNATDSKIEAFPKPLRYKVDSNIITDKKTEPLAGDARIKGKKQRTLLKLLAGILGVNFADLWERDKKQTTKEIAIRALIIVLFLGMSIFSYTYFYISSTNKELDSIKIEIAQTKYRLKQPNIPRAERSKLNKRLEELEEAKKRKEDTLKWFGETKTEITEKAKKAYDEKGVDASLAILNSPESLQEDEKVSEKYILKAKLYIEKYDYKQAEKAYEIAISVAFEYDSIFEYADYLRKQNKFGKSEELYRKLLKLELTKEQKAIVLNDLAVLHEYQNRLVETEKEHQEALKIYRELAKKNPDKFNSYVAMSLNNLAILHRKQNRLVEAEKEYKESLKIYKVLAKKNPNKFNSYVAMSLNNLAVLYRSQNRLQEAEKECQEALKILRELAKKNPDKFNSYVAMSLNNLAVLHQRQNRLQEAKKEHKESLKIYRELAKKNPKVYDLELARVLLVGYDYQLDKTINPNEIEQLLKKYPNIPKATKFLKMLYGIKQSR